MARLPKTGWARQDSDPFLQEIYRALAYHENTEPGALIEFSCNHCPATFVGSSPRLLAADIYDHLKKAHPEQRQFDVPR